MLMRTLKQRILPALAAFFLFMTSGFPQPWGTLTNDHAIVIEHLIQLHDSFAGQVTARNSADPAHADSRQLGIMNLFGVSASGYQTLARVLSAAKANLDAVRTAQSRYVAGMAPNAAAASVSAALGSYQNQQLAILHAVPTDLKRQLSSADWTGLQAFISAELTAKIHVGMAAAPKFVPLPVLPPGTGRF